MISKGCLYHIVRFQVSNSKIPLIESVPLLREFLEVFPNHLSGLPPEREIDFGIDMLSDKNCILIPLCRMAPTKFNDLTAQLKDLLDKGFI